ncbi:MAG: GH32 C-terminal domain-containing protein [Clostridia bacterium]|nr:GH32 C-terminal domain-containing protein [Clostridia bacterium]
MKKLLALVLIPALVASVFPTLIFAEGAPAFKAISEIPYLTGLESSIELDIPFSKDALNYWASTTENSVDLSATAPDGVSVSIQDSGKASGKVSLTPGLNVIPVKLSGASGENTVYINIIRHQTSDKAFNDTFRQQLHYSNEMFSINDPNGLIYDKTTGIYHLMFQSDFPLPNCDYKVQGDSKHWGHAVSRNLIDWEYVGPAIVPDENGVIWSGSGVIDKNNTSGLFDESTPADSRMVFLFTYYGEKTHGGVGDLGLTSIGLAYSDDHGQSFKKLDKVVIPNTNNRYASGLRDPKVIWYEDESMENGGIWVMIACGDKTVIFTSHDLISWEYQSMVRDVNGRHSLQTECPDLFPLECDGKTEWVLSGSGAWFVVGDLGVEEGKMTFTPRTEQIWPTNGVIELWGPGSSELFPEAYAAQTFYNDELDRRIQVNWIRDFGSYPGKLWYNTLSLPTELSLTKINGEYRLCYKPIAELEQKREDKLVDIKDTQINAGEDPLSEVKGSMLDIHAVIDPLSANEFGFILHKGAGKYIDVRYDAKKGTVITDKTKTDPANAFKYETALERRPDGTVEVRIILDTHSVEAWFNDAVRHTGNAYISNVGDGCEFYCDSAVKVVSMQVYTLSGMDRSSMTKDMANLNSLYGELKALADNKNAPISEVKQALERYNALTSGQKYCMPEGSAELAALLEARAESSLDPLWIVIPAAVLIIAAAAVLISLKNKKQK